MTSETDGARRMEHDAAAVTTIRAEPKLTTLAVRET